MKIADKVKETVKSQGLLEDDNKIKRLDSIDMIDLLVELEKATGISIPSASFREEMFESIDSLTRLFEQFEDN